MRLKSVWISNYKNLRDFPLSFDGDSFLDIFVGKNGTGKSNFSKLWSRFSAISTTAVAS
jgi:predicted ATPase